LLVAGITPLLAACGSDEGDQPTATPAPADAPRRGSAGAAPGKSFGAKNACPAGDPNAKVPGPFSRELVDLCIEFSKPGAESVAACKGSTWNCTFHSEILRTRDERKLIAEEARKEGQGDASSKFERVMNHILRWEGGCSNHPADNGGRTFKGITTSRARANGWKGDVCTMPTSRVLSIYRQDFWGPEAKKQPWPLDLAVMNTAVNSGPGQATVFLARMDSRGVAGSAREKARWFVDQQTAFYRAIVARKPSQKVFLQGWLNRSAYMQDIIAGRTVSEWSLPGFAETAPFLARPVDSGSAKAYVLP
jgi:hypothetical protein